MYFEILHKMLNLYTAKLADDIFKRILWIENAWISLKIPLKFVPKVRINNNPALVQIMAWRRAGDKPLSEPMMVSLPTHICVTRPQWVSHMISWTDKYVSITTQLVLPLSHHKTFCYIGIDALKPAHVHTSRQHIKSLRPRQDGRHFRKRHFHIHFLEWKLLISNHSPR